MSLHESLRNEMTEALRQREELRLSVIRGLVTAFTNVNVAKKRKPDVMLTDDEVVEVIRRAAKQRKDSIEQFAKGGRDDLAARERDELELLERYLPQMMSREAILERAAAMKDELGVDDVQKKGLLMSTLMKEFAGRAEGADVKIVVDSLF